MATASIGTKVGGTMSAIGEKPLRMGRQLRFSSASLRYRDQLRELFSQTLREFAEEHAAQNGRSVVAEEDFAEVAERAFRDAAKRISQRAQGEWPQPETEATR